MPHLVRVFDRIPREKRIVLDLWGRYNDTIRVDHDFNHLEKLDGHVGWEWSQAFEAVSAVIAQPTLNPLRSGVQPFLFHGFDPTRVVRPFSNAEDAAAAWTSADAEAKPYGAIYIGNNWHRWHQLKSFIERYDRVRRTIGPVCIIGWDWDRRPDWAENNGLAGIYTDAALLDEFGVERFEGARFEDVPTILGRARFAPVFHRPLFNHLGLATNRTFETFYGDCLPVLMLAPDFVSRIYGEAALALVPGEDVAEHFEKVCAEPQHYWDAVLKTRAYLAEHHSFAGRFDELNALGLKAAGK
ncbi:MAG: hypothetical protein AB7V46_25215 [Thermomicrobiales bacterium]